MHPRNPRAEQLAIKTRDAIEALEKSEEANATEALGEVRLALADPGTSDVAAALAAITKAVAACEDKAGAAITSAERAAMYVLTCAAGPRLHPGAWGPSLKSYTMPSTSTPWQNIYAQFSF